jgi:hypothetical protein
MSIDGLVDFCYLPACWNVVALIPSLFHMALLMPETACIACIVCEMSRSTQATVRGNARLPNGWKRFKDDVYCAKCWRDRFVLRAIVLPIHKPLESDWTYLKEALRRCWKESTALANWAINELAKADVVRTNQLERLPPMSRVNLYQEARARFPQLNCQSVNAILRYAEKNYRRLRLKVVWLNEASLPVYRYPAPFPVSNQAWKASFDAEGKPVISVPLMNDRVTVMLRDGRGYRRQLAAFKQIVEGDAVQGELSLYRQKASTGDHRPGFTDRKSSGSARVPFRAMAKLIAWLPREVAPAPALRGTLTARACGDSFLVVEGAGLSQPWVLNADHVRRWFAEQRRRRLRLQTDQKAGIDPQNRVQLSDRQLSFVEKHKRRIDTWCHQASAMLAQLAERLRVADIHFDDSDRSYIADFPWSRFERYLKAKLDERKIQFVSTSSQPEKKAA